MIQTPQDRQQQRITFWGDSYLQSTKESYCRAQRFFDQEDYFTAYLYLFAAFNNLYCLLARFERNERSKIRWAVERIEDSYIPSIYTPEYFSHLDELNQRTPEQFFEGPDKGAALSGVVNMKDYLLGKEPDACVAHVESVAPVESGTQEKRRTLQDLAACLLYTVRNNQFHAIKGPHNLADQRTLLLAYKLLAPIVRALLVMGEKGIQAVKTAGGR